MSLKGMDNASLWFGTPQEKIGFHLKLMEIGTPIMAASRSTKSATSTQRNVPMCGCEDPIQLFISRTENNLCRRSWKCVNWNVSNLLTLLPLLVCVLLYGCVMYGMFMVICKGIRVANFLCGLTRWAKSVQVLVQALAHVKASSRIFFVKQDWENEGEVDEGKKKNIVFIDVVGGFVVLFWFFFFFYYYKMWQSRKSRCL